MAWEIQDRYLWLGFGAFLFVAVKGISNALRTTIHLSEVFDPDHAKATNETQAKDSISLKALSTLAASPNPDIANAATSLLLSRFAQDESTSTSLTKDLFSSNDTTRRKAKQTLELFDSLGTDLYPLRDSVVSELHDKSGPATQIMCRAYFRASRHYRLGRLSFLSAIADAIEDSTVMALSTPRYHDSHFVFPMEDTRLGVRFQPVSQRVESLVDMLAEQAVAARPTVRFASEQSSGSSSTSDLPALEDIGMVDGSSPVTRARLHSESTRETEARRRRREAMVLHEGGGVIGMENIIHPRTHRDS